MLYAQIFKIQNAAYYTIFVLHLFSHVITVPSLFNTIALFN